MRGTARNRDPLGTRRFRPYQFLTTAFLVVVVGLGACTERTVVRTFSEDEVREDFVRWYDSLVVADVAYQDLGDAPVDASVVNELRQLGMVGVRAEGTVLHVSNFLMETRLDAMTPDEVAEAYEMLTSPANQDELDAFQRCLASALASYFSSLVVHGSGDSFAIVELPNSLGGSSTEGL